MTLAEQDRSRWDPRLTRRGLERLRLSASGSELSSYHLEAEIASCHALAASLAATDWGRIVELYDELVARHPSPVVALNRAIGVGHLRGPAVGLAELDALVANRALAGYHPLHAARGEFLSRLGRGGEAAAAFRLAAATTSNEPVRRFLERRLAELGGTNPSG